MTASATPEVPTRLSRPPRRYQMYIAGEWVEAHGGETFESVDPFTGEPSALVPRAGAQDVDDAVRAARRAFDDGPWRRTTAVQRGRMMRRLGELIAEHAHDVAVVESIDNGKLIREMEGQLRGLPDYYEYFAGAADKLGGETIAAARSSFFIYHGIAMRPCAGRRPTRRNRGSTRRASRSWAAALCAASQYVRRAKACLQAAKTVSLIPDNNPNNKCSERTYVRWSATPSTTAVEWRSARSAPTTTSACAPPMRGCRRNRATGAFWQRPSRS